MSNRWTDNKLTNKNSVFLFFNSFFQSVLKSKSENEVDFFSFKHFHDSPKRVFSFFGLSVSLFCFFFSSSLHANHFQPANEQILIKQKSFR